MKRDKEAIGTITIYVTFLVIILAAAAFTGRFVLFRPWTARTFTAAAALNDKAWLFGGRHHSGSPMDDILIADFKENTLKKGGNLPEPIMLTSAFSAGDSIFTAGGYNGKNYIPTVYRYDPAAETCKPFTELPYPAAFGSLSGKGTQLYYTGGWDGKQVRSEILKIDTADGKVTIAAVLPVPLQYASTLITGSCLYIFGGEDDRGELSSAVYCFNLESGVIKPAGTLPQPISRTAAALIDNTIYLAGGWGAGITDSIVSFKPDPDGSLISGSSGTLIEPAADLTALGLNGQMYLFGGTDPTMKRQIRISRYDPVSGITKDTLLKSFIWW